MGTLSCINRGGSVVVCKGAREGDNRRLQLGKSTEPRRSSVVRTVRIARFAAEVRLMFSVADSGVPKLPWEKFDLWMDAEAEAGPDLDSTLVYQLRQRNIGKFVRDNAIELGPTFIKLGQLAGSRSDLFTKEFIGELSDLQDSVPPMSIEDVMAVLDKEEISLDYFKSFDNVPFSAASLGQAHLAELYDGTSVVVKIQREGIAETIDSDMNIISNISAVIDMFDIGNTLQLRSLCEENWRVLREEIDYRIEVKNMEVFSEMFKNKKGIVIPSVIKETEDGKNLNTRRVLTMLYVPGIKPTDIQGLSNIGVDREALAYRLMRLYLYQVVTLGVFHGDSHPGNLAIMEDGSIVMYDFGMIGRLPPKTKELLSEFLVNFYMSDYPALFDVMRELNMLSPNADITSVSATAYMFKEYIQNGNVEVNDDSLALAMDKPLRLPVDFVLVLRAFTITEGICKTLDPDFNTTDVAMPFVDKIIPKSDLAGIYQSNMLMLPMKILRIEKFIDSLEIGRTKLRVQKDVGMVSVQRSQKIMLAIFCANMFVNGSYDYMSTAMLAVSMVFVFL